MQIFGKAYDKVLALSREPKAFWYLLIVAFTESSFFLIPPDVMLAPMSLAKPKKAYYYALSCTIASVLGGCFGYLLGFAFLHLIYPFLVKMGYLALYQKVIALFKAWGFWIVFVAGFSPIPYKIFTIAAGAFHVNFMLFMVASFISRGARFFLVAGLMAYGGERLESKLRSYIDLIGWLTVVSLLLAFIYYYWLHKYG